jgi:transposase-like protein
VICPHCNYEYRVGYPRDGVREVVGDKGDFYSLPIRMERTEEFGWGREYATPYACPSCKKTFVD